MHRLFQNPLHCLSFRLYIHDPLYICFIVQYKCLLGLLGARVWEMRDERTEGSYLLSVSIALLVQIF
jgi:hypothetical protein